MRKLDGPILESPPRVEELEVSVFGPGFGECIVVHLTGNTWLVIDSCLDPQTKEPAALVYFQKIGVDVSKDVRLVVSTHWHNDHIRGIGRVFEKCEAAKFVSAHGLGSKEFKNLVSSYSGYFPSGGSGVEEMRQIFSTLKSRLGGNAFISPEFASAGTILYERPANTQILVKALSPSSAAYFASIVRFAEELIPKEGQRRSPVPSVGPNDLSIVLTVRVAGLGSLLGADLEEVGRTDLGWQAVLDRFCEIDNSHEGIKISHHGSETGHHLGIWPKMMKEDAWSALTPYLSGRRHLPSKRDVKRICSLSKNAYITAPRSTTKYRHPKAAVRKQLREMGVSIVEEGARQGHIRFRRRVNDPNAEWTVELFGNACELALLLRSPDRRRRPSKRS
jgi:hypothetical protein